MAAQNIGRLVNQYLADGGAIDFRWGDNNAIQIGDGAGAGVGDASLYWDGTDLILNPAVDDSLWKIGDGTTSFDVKLFGASSAGFISWDASGNDLKFEDSVSVHFGTGSTAGMGAAGDIEMRWDGTDFDILGLADDQIIKIGNGTNSFDLWLYGNSASLYTSWDASASQLKYEDSVKVYFGTGAGAGPGNAGDVYMAWDATDLVMIPAVDDSVFRIGNGTLDMDVVVYGNTVNSYFELDASLDQVGLRGPMRTRGFNCLPRRFELKWVAGARGKPAINADIQDASEAVRMIADPDFEILGNNASSDDVTYYVEGGIKMETDGGGTDSVILCPHLDANQSAWSQVTWGTDQETVWEAHIKTNAITPATIWAGLKLTNTSVTATDNDQVFFRYQNSVNGDKWQAIYSINNVDTAGDSGVTVSPTTEYHFKISIDSSRIAKMYINGALVATSTALTNAVDLIPYIGILEGSAAAKSLFVFGQSISRNFA